MTWGLNKRVMGQALADTVLLPPAEGEQVKAVTGRDRASLIVGHKLAEVAEFESKVGAALARDRQRRSVTLLWRIAAYLVPFLLILTGRMAR